MGLHLNLTEGPPMACVDTVPSLVEYQDAWWPAASEQTREKNDAHRDGGDDKVLHMRGKSGLRQALRRCEISLEEVGREVEAQIAAFKQLTGAAPVYIDGHQHVHVLPGIAAVVAQVAERATVQFVRIPDEPAQNFQVHVDAARTAFYKSVTSQAADARDVFRDEGLVAPDDFMGLGLMGADLTLERLQQRLTRVLHAAAGAAAPALPPAKCSEAAAVDVPVSVGNGCRQHEVHDRGAVDGLLWGCRSGGGKQTYVAEYMCHVGKASALGDDFNRSADRDLELQVLSDPSLPPWLRAHNIALTSYHELAKSRPPPPDPCGRGPGVGTSGVLRHGGETTSGDSGQTSMRMLVNEDEAVAERRTEKTRTKRTAPSGKLLILSSMTAATGNATTALRLAAVARVIFAPVSRHPVSSVRLSRRARCCACLNSECLDAHH